MARLRRFAVVLLAATIVAGLAGCARSAPPKPDSGAAATGVFYEIFVRSFYDTDGDGIGDLNGVAKKLEYLQKLGVSGIWLMPLQPSPSYHGYDVTDYYGINPDYGTMADFTSLVSAAHQRGIKVILDMVFNHSSSKHPWFQEANADAGSPRRNWYIWAGADTNTDAISATGGQAWHSAANGKYLGVFWEGMPDLNLDNADVRHELIRIGQFWLQHGVDGFRLDAAKHVYEDFSGSRNDPQTAEKNRMWWQEFRNGLNEVNPDVYLIGEIWDSPAVIGPYLDQAFNAGFNFDLAGQLINMAKDEQAADIGFTLSRIYEYYRKVSHGKFRDAPFLSNHDQNRVMTRLNGDLNHAKMAAALLLTLPGNPFIYYGEEIGMEGAKPDESIREPMRWNRDGKAGNGQTTWEVPRFNRQTRPSVEAQDNNPASLLNWYRTLISWRAKEPLLTAGFIHSFAVPNRHVAAYLRGNETTQVLVMHNLSGEAQTVAWAGGTTAQRFHEVELATSEQVELTKKGITLPPYTSVIVK